MPEAQVRNCSVSESVAVAVAYTAARASSLVEREAVLHIAGTDIVGDGRPHNPHLCSDGGHKSDHTMTVLVDHMFAATHTSPSSLTSQKVPLCWWFGGGSWLLLSLVGDDH